jgi:hypothetical protein
VNSAWTHYREPVTHPVLHLAGIGLKKAVASVRRSVRNTH